MIGFFVFLIGLAITGIYAKTAFESNVIRGRDSSIDSVKWRYNAPRERQHLQTRDESAQFQTNSLKALR